MARVQVDWWSRIAPLLLIALGAVAYADSLTAPFLFDDDAAIARNPHIQKLTPFWEIFQAAPSTPSAGRPVVSLTLALNYAVAGLDVRMWHAFNLCLHILSGWLLFALTRLTLRSSNFPDDVRTASAPLALSIALVWLVHPLLTDSVTYIIQRTELVMAVFYLATLYAAARAWDSPRPRWWMAASIFCCGMGMASKEVMVSAPLLVLLYDLAFHGGNLRLLWPRRRGLYVGLAGTWLILIALIATGPRADTVGFAHKIAPWAYLQSQCWAIQQYLRLSVWPDSLSLDYGLWKPITIQQALPGAALIGCLLGVTAWGWRRQRAIGFLGAWFFLILAPTSSFVPIITEVAAERRMYLPLVAVVVLFVVGGYLLGLRVFRAMQVHPAAQYFCFGMSMLVIVSWLGYETSLRNMLYGDSLTLWRDAAAKYPENERAQCNVGLELLRRGAGGEALDVYVTLGKKLILQGRPDEAVQVFRTAEKIDPHNAELLRLLKQALAQQAVANSRGK